MLKHDREQCAYAPASLPGGDLPERLTQLARLIDAQLRVALKPATQLHEVVTELLDPTPGDVDLALPPDVPPAVLEDEGGIFRSRLAVHLVQVGLGDRRAVGLRGAHDVASCDIVLSCNIVLMIVSPFREVMQSRSRFGVHAPAGAAFIVRASTDTPQGNRRRCDPPRVTAMSLRLCWIPPIAHRSHGTENYSGP